MSNGTKIEFTLIGSDKSFYNVELRLEHGEAGAVDINIWYKKAVDTNWKFLAGELMVDEKPTIEQLRADFSAILATLTTKIREFFRLSGNDDLPPTEELMDRLAALLQNVEWDSTTKRLKLN